MTTAEREGLWRRATRAAGRAERQPYRQWRLLGLVAAGGAIGTSMREALSVLEPDAWVFPITTFAINVAGAIALGLLLEVLVRSGTDAGRRRGVRLLVGTGVLGGFTSYSAIATSTALLLTAGQWWWAAAYALGTVVLGAVASVAGIALGHLITRRKQVGA